MKGELGLTVIFVSHDLRAVSAISDRIACLNRSLHYHDVPGHLPPDLVYRMFACDLEAMGIKGGHVCTHGHGAGGVNGANGNGSNGQPESAGGAAAPRPGRGDAAG